MKESEKAGLKLNIQKLRSWDPVLSVQFSRSVMSDSLWSQGLQHTRLPCPSPLPNLAQTHVHRVSDAIQPSHPLLSFLLLLSILPSIRVFSNESFLRIRWSKYRRFSFSINPSNEYSRLTSFSYCLDLLAVQGTLKSLLQHHSSKASILWRSAFFIVWLSHPYLITGKIIALTRWTFVGKVMSLLFNMLSRLAIAFLPRSNQIFTSWQVDGETIEKLTDFIFLGSKITADGDCSHAIKRCLLLGRKTMTNLDSILRSRDITLLTKVHVFKGLIFPELENGFTWKLVFLVRIWESDHKEGWGPKSWCFWTVVLEKTLESPWDCKVIKPVNLKGNQSWIFIGRTDAETEAPIVCSPYVKNWLTGKDIA